MNTTSQTKKNGSITGKLITGLIFGFLVILALAFFGDIQNVKSTISSFKWRVFPLALLFTLFNYALRFVKWNFYIHNIHNCKINLLESLRIFVAGFPLAVTPGKVGEALKGIWLKQASGLPVAKGISIVVAERISDGLAVLILSTLGVIAYPKYWPAFLIVLFLLLIIIVISQIRPAALWILSILDKLPFINKISKSLLEFYEGSYMLFKPKATLLAVGLGTISWLGEGIGFYLILLGLGLSPGYDLLGIAIFVLSFSTVVGAISALPGGLGAAEASIAGMLILTVGLNNATATTATLLIRFATLWFGVILGLITWSVSPKLFKNQTTEYENNV